MKIELLRHENDTYLHPPVRKIEVRQFGIAKVVLLKRKGVKR